MKSRIDYCCPKYALSSLSRIVRIGMNCYSAANTSPLEGHTVTPFYLFTGRQARTPMEVGLSTTSVTDIVWPQTVDAKREYTQQVQARLKVAHDFLRGFRHRQQQAWIARRDKETLPIPFKAGDYVITSSPKVIKGISSKLLTQFAGPFEVVGEHHLANGLLAPNTYDLKRVHTGDMIMGINAQLLHRYRPGTAMLMDNLDPEPKIKTSTPENQAGQYNR